MNEPFQPGSGIHQPTEQPRTEIRGGPQPTVDSKGNPVYPGQTKRKYRKRVARSRQHQPRQQQDAAQQGQQHTVGATEASRAERPIDAEQITRQRYGDGTNEFEIPAHLKRPGWDYQWRTTHIVGQPVDPSETQANYRGGWRPVKPSEMPDMVPPGWTKDTIERMGQIMMMRPQHLSDEATLEFEKRAYEQQEMKNRAVLAGQEFHDMAGVVRPVNQGFTLEGEAGRTRGK